MLEFHKQLQGKRVQCKQRWSSGLEEVVGVTYTHAPVRRSVQSAWRPSVCVRTTLGRLARPRDSLCTQAVPNIPSLSGSPRLPSLKENFYAGGGTKASSLLPPKSYSFQAYYYQSTSFYSTSTSIYNHSTDLLAICIV